VPGSSIITVQPRKPITTMPFYEYECQSCKFYTEVMQKITDAPLTKCPSCGKKALQKLVSAPVFRLKGAGWYETDFKSDKENKRNLAGGDKDEPKAEAKSDTKTDAKATPAVETKSTAAEPAESTRRSASASKSAGRSTPAKGKSKAAARAPSRAPTKAKAKAKGKAKGRR
jgi:putative FmdB family regulatory protein